MMGIFLNLLGSFARFAELLDGLASLNGRGLLFFLLFLGLFLFLLIKIKHHLKATPYTVSDVVIDRSIRGGNPDSNLLEFRDDD